MKITKSNYYSRELSKQFFTASFCKEMLQCEAAATAKINGLWDPPKTTALAVGSYVDAAFESEKLFHDYCASHPEIMKRDGTIKADFEQANAMIQRAKSDPVFMRFMRGRHQTILTGEIGGVPFKAKLDVYKPNERIVDLKTTRSMESVYVEGQGRVSFATAWHYPLQLAIYQALEGNKLPCYLAVITKEDPPDIDIIEVPQDMLDAEMELLLDRLPRYDAIRNGLIEPDRCEHCAYCRITKRLTGPRSLAELEFN